MATLRDDILTELDTIYDANELGVTITTTGASVVGIFQNEYADIDTEFLSVTGSTPYVRLKNTDITNLQVGDSCTIAGDNYVVLHHEPNGENETVVILREN